MRIDLRCKTLFWVGIYASNHMDKFSNVIRLVVNLSVGEEFYPLVGETKRNDFVNAIHKDTLEVMLGELDTPNDLLTSVC